jgi:hypothetical protein
MVTREDVLAALAELGSTSKAVAMSLRRLRVKGFRMRCRCCPIARHLARSFKGCEVRVDGTTIWLTWQSPWAVIVVAVPQPIRKFINRFDNGEFDYLLEA